MNAIAANFLSLAQPRPPSPPPASATCWVCLDASPPSPSEDGTRDKLTRGCSCRGQSAGYAHPSCLAQYARRKCKNAVKREVEKGLQDHSAAIAATDPWTKCPNCQKYYTGQLSLSMAEMFVESLEGMPNLRYPRFKALLQLSTARQECGMRDSAQDLLEKLQAEYEDLKTMMELKEILSTTITADVAALLKSTKVNVGLEIYHVLSVLHQENWINTRDIESAKKFKEYSEKALEIAATELDFDHFMTKMLKENVKQAIKMIAFKKTHYADKAAGKRTNIAALEQNRLLYEQVLDEKGADSEDCLVCALKYQQEMESDDAVDFLEENYQRSRRGLGEEHCTTRLLGQTLTDRRMERHVVGLLKASTTVIGQSKVSATIVGLENKQPHLNGKLVEVVRYAKNSSDTYIVIIRDGRDVSNKRKFKAKAANLLFSKGTIMKFVGLKSPKSHHLNGKIASPMHFDNSKSRYAVYSVDDKMNSETQVLVKPGNLVVWFEIYQKNKQTPFQ